MNSTEVIEWAPFRLKPDTAEADLLVASDELQREFLAIQPGHVRRQLLKANDGSYVDMVLWASRRAAEEAMARVAASPACARYFALMHETDGAPGAGVSHYLSVRTY